MSNRRDRFMPHALRPARCEAHALLHQTEDYIACPVVRRSLPSMRVSGPPSFEIIDYDFSQRHWDTAKHLRDEQIEAVAPAHSRLRNVQSELVDLFTAGDIRTGLRGKQKPDVAPLAANVWSVVKLHNVFSWYQIDPREPGTHSSFGDAFHWVYVLREDVEAYVSTNRESAAGVTSAKGRDAFTKRLRSMMEAAPDNPRPKSLVLEELNPEFAGLSSRQQKSAWTEVAREFPAWSRAGPRPRAR